MTRFLKVMTAAIIVVASAANAEDRGVDQWWDSNYTARELLADCTQKATVERCIFFIQTVAQASFWFDKCIPRGTTLTEIGDITRAFVEKNAKYADSPATNVLLTAIHEKWKCQ
jgi:hypothetical protein